MGKYKSTIDCKYIRDKAGNVWIMKIQLSDTGYLDIYCNTEKNSRTYIQSKIHLLQAKIDEKEKYCRITGIINYEEYRRLHIGSWMVSELISLCKAYGIPQIRGDLSPVDAKSDEDHKRRDDFWSSLGAEITYKTEDLKQGEFIINTNKPTLKEIKAYEIMEHEFNVQLDLINLKREYEDCSRRADALHYLLKQEINKPFLLMLKEVIERSIYSVLYIIFYPFFRLMNRFSRNDKDSQNDI